MGSSPRKDKDEILRTDKEGGDLYDPFYSLFGFESAREKTFPTLDVFENADSVCIEAELPGIRKEEISITLEEGRLVLDGEKARDKSENEKVSFLCMERTFGRFRRVIGIPAVADASRIKADFKDGVLRITIPKVADLRKKTRKIDIE